MLQPSSVAGIAAGVAKYGPAPGAADMLDRELMAAKVRLIFIFRPLHTFSANVKEAVESRFYTVYRCKTNTQHPDFCTRVASIALCFCGHALSGHNQSRPNAPCRGCSCPCYSYIPYRPEEIGEWWLPRRKVCLRLRLE